MNRTFKILPLLFLLAGSVFMGGCVKEKFDPPSLTAPAVGFSSNTTIAALNQLYYDSLNPGFGKILSDIIIQGIVVANDQSGNIYKTLYIQDATAGIQIAIDLQDMYTSYRLGQSVLIKCKGLYLGNYGGVVELGYLYDGGIGRIPAALAPQHLFADGFPGPAPTPAVVTLPLATSRLSTLIRIDSVFFSSGEVGQPFSIPTATTDRHISDLHGNSMVVRTSNYATFAGKLIPGKMGSIVGIFSQFNGTAQLYLRDTTDLINFTQVSPFFLNESFATGLGVFTEYSVTGAEIWVQATYSGITYAKMSGYTGANHANEDWLISPSLDLDQYATETLSFKSSTKYGTTGDGSLRLFYSTDYVSGAPSTGTWTEITGFTLSPGNFVLTPSGNINLSAISGTNVHLAFRYISTTSSAATWELTSIVGKGVTN